MIVIPGGRRCAGSRLDSIPGPRPPPMSSEYSAVYEAPPPPRPDLRFLADRDISSCSSLSLSTTSSALASMPTTPATPRAVLNSAMLRSKPPGTERSCSGCPLPGVRLRSFSHLRMVELFHLFLTAFSVRPGRILEISHQRLPKCFCASNKTRSSSPDQSPRLMTGSKWLNQRSRHCLPIRPGSLAAMALHLTSPVFCETISLTILSSASLHAPLWSPGFSTLFHLCKHCTSVRVGPSNLAIFFQFLAPCSLTITRSAASSRGVHLPPMLALRRARGYKHDMAWSGRGGREGRKG